MKSHMTSRLASSLALLGLLASCGQSSSGGGGGSSKARPSNTTPGNVVEEVSIPADGTNIDGHYLAPFTTLNPHVNGTIPGSASFFRKEDRFFAYLRLFAGGVRAWHPQKVYTGSRCPTIEDDSNGDGYIDIVEAEKVVGKVLIPLDADLGSQMNGRNFYPVGDLSGSYYYERLVSFSRFFKDLKAEDKDPADNIVKLAPEEGLSLIGRVVMVQGTAETVEYPETVSSGSTRYRPHQTLPIACGVFKKVSAGPGTPDDGVIPGPVAEVEEGQDHPAPDAGTISNGSGDGEGGGTNETGSGDTETEDENGNRDRPVNTGSGSSSGSSSGSGSGTGTGSTGTGSTETGSTDTDSTDTGSTDTGSDTGTTDTGSTDTESTDDGGITSDDAETHT